VRHVDDSDAGPLTLVLIEAAIDALLSSSKQLSLSMAKAEAASWTSTDTRFEMLACNFVACAAAIEGHVAGAIVE
jgi:hypothetical protein